MSPVRSSRDRLIRRRWTQLVDRAAGRAPQALSGLAVFVLAGTAMGCGNDSGDKAPLTAEIPLHLEEHLGSASVEGAELPDVPPERVVWTFDEPRPDWRPVGYRRPDRRLPTIEEREDAVRISLSSEERPEGWRLPHGGYAVDVPNWDLEDWAYAIVELRNEEPIDHLELGINIRENEEQDPHPAPFETYTPQMPVIDDGAAHSYVVRLNTFGNRPAAGEWRQLGVYLAAEEPASADLLSVTLVPVEADYADRPVGVRMSEKGSEHLRAIYTHGESRIDYRVSVPGEATLAFGLGVLREGDPVRFRVVAAGEKGTATTLLDETYSDPEAWGRRTLDLSPLAGQTVNLRLETEANVGTVGLWGAPILSGESDRVALERPNVILYILDGGGADYMSVFGYNRSNTPELEQLAEQGVVFERAYSNATWTKPSTMSFMTSLPHSALGGFKGEADRVPDEALTMGEILHASGYQTAVIVSNPFAGSMSGLERGADFLHETGIEPNNSESSRLLHESFWRWRESRPGKPFWVHFQSTDIHEPFRPVAPFSGVYVDPELRRAYEEWDPKLYPGPGWRRLEAYEKHGIDRVRYSYAQQGLYDEAMAHNDYRIGELVERLEERGEWENTILIVAADHGYPAACHRLMDPLAPIWGPMFNSHETHVPMVFVWPGRIEGGRRFTMPVSMLDLLPTLLDLLDLPVPETARGRSLAPLLLGESALEPRPVVLEEFNVDDESGELYGLIEVIDGWWGASLQVGENAANEIGTGGASTEDQREVPLLLYDLRNDPFTLESVHEEHPELVTNYTHFLKQRLEEHKKIGEQLGRSGEVTVGREQLEALRALGYID